MDNLIQQVKYWIFRLVNIVKNHDSLIVIGETGSGKTTQIPQFLFEGGLATSGCIGITQPRRVAAVSIASRVAQEQAIELGKLVGYCVRFQDVTSVHTKIKYMTDGMMVREAMTDEILSDYSVHFVTHKSIVTDSLRKKSRCFNYLYLIFYFLLNSSPI